MLSRGFSARLPGVLLLLALSVASLAQTPPAAAPPDAAQTLTLQVQSRLVLEDILVFDQKGNPVHNLPPTAFHVTDNDHPQIIRSLTEGAPASTTSAVAPPLPVGTFRNTSSATDQTTSAALLIDADSMAIEDQLYLFDQLSRSLAHLPPSLQIAVFRVINGRVVQIRSFSSDRADLHRALNECLPNFSQPVDDHFDSAVNQLLTVASFLEQTPGRKNILWFAGAFPLVSLSDAEANSLIKPDSTARLHIIHQLQEVLAEARVSVYPIDVRGVIPLTTGSLLPASPGNPIPALTGSPNPAAASAFTLGSPLGPPALGVADQRHQMHLLADATGGKAYTLNHLTPEIDQAFDLGLHAYALAYTPSPYTNDGSWHRVRIAVDPPASGPPGPYTLSYRPGYLATWTAIPGGRVGIRLEPGSLKSSTGGPASALLASPLPFEVRIDPAPPEHNTLPITLHLTIPSSELSFRHTGPTWHSQLVLVSFGYNAIGRMRGGHMQQFDTTLTEQHWQEIQGKRIPLTHTLTVPHDAAYLMVELRDSNSLRVGSLMLSMRAVRALPTSTQQPVGRP